MSQGLPVSRLINVTVTLASAAATFANVGSCIIIGDSPVISVAQRVRTYSTLAAVGTDFGSAAPEYKAAAHFFAQSPQPTQLTIGFWNHGSESALAALQACDAIAGGYAYGVMFATPDIADSDHLAIAAYVEGSSPPHIYGVGTTEAGVPVAATTTDIASELTSGGFTRTFGQWSSTDPYAIASIFGIAATINWAGANTAPNFMYQSEPGVTAEVLSPAQAAAMDAKRINYYAAYQNGASILEAGVMFGPRYLDEVIGCDWLANYVQTNLFNLQTQAVQGGFKIPQTDAGVHLLQNNIEASLTQAVGNGLLAPGTWSAAGFGSLNTGDFMPKGFYVFVPSVAVQSATARAARQSPPFQIAAKLAGAVDSVNVSIIVNR